MWLLALATCSGCLPWLPAMAACRGYLPWLSAVSAFHGWPPWLPVEHVCMQYPAVASCRGRCRSCLPRLPAAAT